MSKIRHYLISVEKAISILRQCDIQLTPQRIAVVEYVLKSKAHPSADDVLKFARKKCPTVSRATVYNTLNLLVERGLLRTQLLKEGTVVFDPNIQSHHHFIDEETGVIYDIPWNSVSVSGEEKLREFEVHEYQVIMRGKLRKKK
ncbi:MAG: Fur family transcriptional regulator [Candidatus Zixiibacteriota bacterium]